MNLKALKFLEDYMGEYEILTYKEYKDKKIGITFINADSEESYVLLKPFKNTFKIMVEG